MSCEACEFLFAAFLPVYKLILLRVEGFAPICSPNFLFLRGAMGVWGKKFGSKPTLSESSLKCLAVLKMVCFVFPLKSGKVGSTAVHSVLTQSYLTEVVN